ncbi:DUF4926 domain-containing protein [Aminobacter sp. P9b]|uniref:DUF4926 domain-containing protein n=1 Tax=Aminobacter sp. P9b TaxID=3133697 RepID=UPI003252DD53
MRQNERLQIKSVPKLFDIVELLEGLPAVGLPAGTQGTVVEELPDAFLLVEFCDAAGHTLAIEPLASEKLAVSRSTNGS